MTISKQNCLTLASRADAVAVSSLRAAAYAERAKFQVSAEALAWNEVDDQSFVFAAWQEGRLIGTYRLEVIDDKRLLEAKLECPWKFGELALPIGLFSRQATAGDVHGQSLSAYFRWHMLQFTQGFGIRLVTGTFAAHPQHDALLRAAGGEVYKHPTGWSSAFRSTQETRVMVLDMERNGALALGFLAQASTVWRERLPWLGERPPLRYVTGL